MRILMSALFLALFIFSSYSAEAGFCSPTPPDAVLTHHGGHGGHGPHGDGCGR